MEANSEQRTMKLAVTFLNTHIFLFPLKFVIIIIIYKVTRGNSVKLIFKVDYKINGAHLSIGKTHFTNRYMSSFAFEISIILSCYLCIKMTKITE